MANVMNFKRVEVKGMTKDEALEKAPFGSAEYGNDCTQSYRNWVEKHMDATEDEKVAWMLDKLKEKTKMVPGGYCYITVEPAAKDTRKRPYEFENVKNESGTRKYCSVYRWVDDTDGHVVVELNEKNAPKDAKTGKPRMTKDAACALLKKMYADRKYSGNAHLIKEKICTDGSAVLTRAKYAPSKSSNVGTYLAFGIEKY